MKLYPTIRLSILVILGTLLIATLDRLASANYLLATEMQKKRIAADTSEPVTRRAGMEMSPAPKFTPSTKED
jgi:hypothetical protein